MKKGWNRKAFTMVELLSVIVILGIIMALAIPAIMKLTSNQVNEKYHYQEKMTKEATELFVDKYKKGLPSEHSCFNINYQSLISDGYLKEPPLVCSGVIQATRKKGNNFTYRYYLDCKDEKGTVIKESAPVPDGCVGIYGKFMIDYVIHYGNASGAKYNYDWTNQNLYQKYTAIDLSLLSSSGSAGIKEFQYSLNKKDWTKIPADKQGNGNWTLSFQHIGKIYFKALDNNSEESEVIEYSVKVDKTPPTVENLKLVSRESYNSLKTKLTLSASDAHSKGLMMCISNTGYEKGCSWESFRSSKDWDLSGSLDGVKRTVYVTVKDAAGNKTNQTVTYTPYKECTSVNESRPANYGACDKKCGGGLQYRTVTVKDKNTGKVCRTYQESRTCNTQSCAPTIVRVGDHFTENLSPLNDHQIIHFESYVDYYCNGYRKGDYSTDSCSWVKGRAININDLNVSYGPQVTLTMPNGKQSSNWGNGIGTTATVRIDDSTIAFTGGNYRSSSKVSRFGLMIIKVSGNNMWVANNVDLDAGVTSYGGGIEGLEYSRGNSFVTMVYDAGTRTNYKNCFRTYDLNSGRITASCNPKKPNWQVMNARFDKEGIVGWTGTPKYPEYTDYIGLNDGTPLLMFKGSNYDSVLEEPRIVIDQPGKSKTIIDGTTWLDYGRGLSMGHLGNDKLIVHAGGQICTGKRPNQVCVYKSYFVFYRKINDSWVREHVMEAPGNGTKNYNGELITLNSNTIAFNSSNNGFYLIRYE